MIRIGRKIEGVNYTKRLGSYVIIEREEDKKIAIATVPEGDKFFLGGGIEKRRNKARGIKKRSDRRSWI